MSIITTLSATEVDNRKAISESLTEAKLSVIHKAAKKKYTSNS